MGCYDGAEVYELVGTYLLNQLMVIIAKENMGLYRDDGLGIFNWVTGKEIYNLSNDQISIIMQPMKTLLFSDGEPWVKSMTRMTSMYQWAATMEQRCASWLIHIC